jgi:hypothetical protein
MSERNTEKERRCEKCARVIRTTAAGIKKHATEDCPLKPKQWSVKK